VIANAGNAMAGIRQYPVRFLYFLDNAILSSSAIGRVLPPEFLPKQNPTLECMVHSELG
jgi:hypothetical protein